MNVGEESGAAGRPVISEFGAVPAYLKAMLDWRRRREPGFSVVRECARLRRCSPSLVTRVVRGQRRLTADRIDAFVKLLALTAEERTFLRRWTSDGDDAQCASPPPKPSSRKRQNHLLSHWLNVYVWEACRLKGFKATPEAIQRLLGPIARPRQIERSLRFLLREGFLRRTLDGRVVQNDKVLTTSDEQLDRKIQAFHRQALKIAGRGMALYPLERRRESAVVMVLDRKSVGELKEMLKDFHEKLLVFAEEHLAESEELYQVTINLSPVGK